MEIHAKIISLTIGNYQCSMLSGAATRRVHVTFHFGESESRHMADLMPKSQRYLEDHPSY